MSQSTSLKDEAADRVEIRELIDAYAHHADRRRPEDQAALFTQDALVEVYQGEPEKNKPVQVTHGRAELASALGVLKNYDMTMHFNGQNTLTIDGDKAAGEVYCLAHHFSVEHGQRTLTVMGIRYYDTYARQNGHWLFAERKLIIDWVDRRPSNP